MTFKASSPLLPSFEFLPSFARHWGFSLGLARSVEEVVALVPAELQPLVVQVCSPPLAETATPPEPRNPQALEEEVRRALPLAATREYPEIGDWVLDVVRPAIETDAAAWLVGVHRHVQGRSPARGGPQPVSAPEHAPSRAYSKVCEAIAWQELPLRAGQLAVELGAAPGGAVTALLERGLDVVAVDPAEMAGEVATHAAAAGRSFWHIQEPAAALRAEQLPRAVDWLLSDMNLAPQVAVRTVERAASLMKKSLRGAIITLKMNDARAVSSIPALLGRLGALGLGAPRSISLPSHRSEIVVVLERSRRES